MDVPLSAVVLTQNVASRVARCLEALAFADEIVVVDACSDDGTDAVARDLGARVVQNPWPGFAAQRRFGIEHARGDWVFMCDSDEVATPELAAEMRAVVDGAWSGTPDGFRIRRRNHYLGRPIRHGPWAGDTQLRLFRRGAGSVTDQSVHEGVVVDGPAGVLDAPLDHYTHDSLFDSVERINRYTTLEARDRAGRRRVGTLDPLLPPVGVFLNYFVRRGGWRDGMAGFMLAVTTAMYKALLYVKIRVIQRGGARPPGAPGAPVDGPRR
jgi:glycosyltransferase involved in cell wall biosynthesis